MKDTFLERIKEFPIIPVFNHWEREVTINVISACYKAGIRVFEFTNRGDHSAGIFKDIISNRFKFPGMNIGIGSIMNTVQAQDYIDAGADFIVSPILDFSVGSICGQAKKSWIPGCGTLTEIINAERAGAELIKIFPGSVLGMDFVKSVLGPCPNLKLMPTGGVSPDRENLEGWFNSGVFSVGMGSKLFTEELVNTKNHDKLVSKIAHLKEILDEMEN
ncbi:MAG: bifunctional 4-hydroxy-2-oxoglutarate aldolase/2-dehydro-3-deoxy-phosphogluconate aldolase [Balneolaceae bacterium]